MPAVAEKGNRYKESTRKPELPRLADSTPPKGPGNRPTASWDGNPDEYFRYEFTGQDPTALTDTLVHPHQIVLLHSPIYTIDTLNPTPIIRINERDIEDTL